MHRKVAIPVEDGKMSVHFGHCQQFAIYETDDKDIIAEDFLKPPTHSPGVYPDWLRQLGVDNVITGGIGNRAIQRFLNYKINVYVGAPVKEPAELVKDLVSGNLKAGENLCDH